MKTWIHIFTLVALLAPEARAQEEAKLEGIMVGATIQNTQSLAGFLGSGAGVAGNVRYWDKYFGFDASLGLSTASYDVGTSDADITTVELSGGPIVGIQRGMMKPWFRLGFGYSNFDSDGGLDADQISLDPSFGVDFQPMRHLVLGLTVFSIRYILDSSFGIFAGAPSDIDGFSFSLLSGISVAYLF